MPTLSGKIVVVIGGTSGVGLGVARGSLLSLAEHVIIASSKQVNVNTAINTLQTLVREKGLPGKISGQLVDANKTDGVKRFVEGLGEIDHLVYTATGRMFDMSAGDLKLDSVRDVLDVRFFSPTVAAKTVKIRPGGSITFTTGRGNRKGWAAGVAIATGAVDKLAQGLAIDLAPIRVNSIALGFVDTNLWSFMPAEQKKAIMDGVAKKLPVQHVADGDEVAEAYLFAMKCTYLTGQALQVEGGSLLVGN